MISNLIRCYSCLLLKMKTSKTASFFLLLIIKGQFLSGAVLLLYPRIFFKELI